jgi:uncharacterized membrane protein YkoI
MKINRLIALAVIALLVVGAMGFITTRGLAVGSKTHQQQAVATQALDTGEASDPGESQSANDTDNIEQQVGDQSTTDTSNIDVGGQASVPAANVTGSSQATTPATSITGIVQVSTQTTSITETTPVVDPTTNITDTTNVNEQVGNQVEDGQPDGAEAPASEAPGAPDTGAQDPSYTSSVAVDQSQTDGLSEVDESAALQNKATISAAEAEAAALAANPGATVIKTELDNENGALVYSVELSNGADVKVDARNGNVLYTDNGTDSEQ